MAGAEGVGRREMPAGERAQVHRQARRREGLSALRLDMQVVTERSRNDGILME